jgi:hypothetical protein
VRDERDEGVDATSPKRPKLTKHGKGKEPQKTTWMHSSLERKKASEEAQLKTCCIPTVCSDGERAKTVRAALFVVRRFSRFPM